MRSRIEGDQVIRGEEALRGMIYGNVRVEPGGALVVYGMICGDLVVSPGGSAHIRGMVDGDVYCAGKLVHAGVICGNLYAGDAAVTTIAADAYIDGEQSAKVLPWRS